MATLWKLQFLLPALIASGASPKCHAFKGKPVWVRYFRRGCTKELQFTRAESPKLCGALLRAVSSEGGEPGSCWTQFPVDRRPWKQVGVQCKGTSFPKYGKYPTTNLATDLESFPATDLESLESCWAAPSPMRRFKHLLTALTGREPDSFPYSPSWTQESPCARRLPKTATPSGNLRRYSFMEG